ncbi:hypothetical protein Y1Q_0015233 [Alligator mississippiensis]|uniref:PLA2c domain-containing protein n=1 Tax=Alligator mississippiensis TaxID=8496 RepID=A0A151P500_ALLMI|nr:hypothetical protein Y1Q_0015233 [Alligator mississippiensis]
MEDKIISLIDAGVAINCAYPLILCPERKVKLILSFDYGPGDPFKTLKQAVEYCRQNSIPFPEVDEKLLREENNPSDVYIFRGENAPTVMHFPLFNKVNVPGKPPFLLLTCSSFTLTSTQLCMVFTGKARN